ncbi:MAG: malonyl-CoA decarboxylase [Proteobacteria bacterium]|nr:malonyl-CoA decarboxylase [Burkholderiales bacterium]
MAASASAPVPAPASVTPSEFTVPDRPEDGLLSSSLRRVRSIWSLLSGDDKTQAGTAGMSRRALDKVRETLNECAIERGGEASARTRAAQMGDAYLRLDPASRLDVLKLLGTEFGADPVRTAAAIATYQRALGTAAQPLAEVELREAVRTRRNVILRQFNALPSGTKFLVDLREHVLKYLPREPSLAALDRDLELLLQSWFDVGFLSLERITWDSPASLLEKLIAYEAVHEIQSWNDLRNRLDSDRRCYAFFHPRMPLEPLIFVEVALTHGLSDNVQVLLDETKRKFDLREADTAMFYSISNTQVGLRGVSFGNFLIKRVVSALQRDMPQLKQFSTLSPVPAFRSWLKRADDAAVLTGARERELKSFEAAFHEPLGAAALNRAIDLAARAHGSVLAELLKPIVLRIVAHYLTTARSSDRPHCPVARFHLSNGARLERLNWLADTSAKGIAQSSGVMVNYLYRLPHIDDNHERFAREGLVVTSSEVRRLL